MFNCKQLHLQSVSNQQPAVITLREKADLLSRTTSNMQVKSDAMQLVRRFDSLQATIRVR